MDLNQFRILNKLKSVYRVSKVGDRNESTAEHTWACLMLADYFLEKYDYNLDKKRVIDLLMYHDVMEIEAGDVSVYDNEPAEQKKAREEKALQKLISSLTREHAARLKSLFHEYEESKTREAQFALAIDKFEPVIHNLDYPKIWNEFNITERMIREKKEKYLKPFPEILALFNEIMRYAREKKIVVY